MTFLIPDLLAWREWLLAILGSMVAWVVILVTWMVRAVWNRPGAGPYRPRDVVSLLVTPAVFLVSVYLVFSGTMSTWRFMVSEPALRSVVTAVLADDPPSMPMAAGLVRIEDAYRRGDGVEILLREGGFIFPSWWGVRWDPTPGGSETSPDDHITGEWYWWYVSD